MLKERKKARWDHEEMVLLARREIDLLAARGRVNVNKCLAEAFPNGTLEAIKGVRKRPVYKELLNNLICGTGTQDGASSVPSEEPSLGSEAHQASSEEWTHDWAADHIGQSGNQRSSLGRIPARGYRAGCSIGLVKGGCRFELRGLASGTR